MYKKAILLFLITAFLVPTVLGYSPVRGFFSYSAGKEVILYVDVENPTDSGLNDVQLKAFNEDLGIRLYTGSFDLGSKDRVTKMMQGDTINKAADGLFRVQATVGGKKIGTKYIPIDIY